MRISWVSGEARDDGKVPIWVRSVNVEYRLHDLKLMVSSLFAEGSCPYAATLSHEDSHMEADRRIFKEDRRDLASEFKALELPTEDAPRWVPPADAEAAKAEAADKIKAVLDGQSNDFSAAMESDRKEKDSPAQYAFVRAQCPEETWEPAAPRP